MTARNLHRLAGAAARIRNDAVTGRAECRICGRPAVGYTETVSGPHPLCAGHADQAERLGYVVHWEELT